MAKWEYKILSVTVNEKWSQKRQADEIQKLQLHLNEMGGNGWEMISYESIPLLGTFSQKLKGYAYLCFFKKQL